MELPDLGDHCSLKECSRLDFLPVKCSGCRKVFCGSHFPPGEHSCSNPPLVDARVPVCPLCDSPVPPRHRGESPDEVVSRHLDNDCQSDRAKENRNKVYDRKCSKRKCKKKELVEIRCDSCKLNFCLQHRHPKDHDCQGPNSLRQNALRSAAQRENQQRGPVSNRNKAQIESDEALARALQASLNQERSRNHGNERTMTQEELDRMMALSLAAETNPAPSSTNTASASNNSNKSCEVS